MKNFIFLKNSYNIHSFFQLSLLFLPIGYFSPSGATILCLEAYTDDDQENYRSNIA